MIVLAIVPAVWRRVMDPRVLAHFGGDISRANISPRKRDQVLAAYAVPPSTVEGGFETGARTPSSTTGSAARPSSTVEDVEGLAWRCPGCDYTYDVVAGEEREGFAAGTAWSEIPHTWCCPDCGVREKVDFVAVQSAAAG
jgi:alkane 1-monooxygenase